MSRMWGRPRNALVLTAAIAAFTATACFGGGGGGGDSGGGGAPPPPPPSPCQSVGAASTSSGAGEPAPPPSDHPITPDQAGAQAREVSSASDVRTKNGEIPLVTVEQQGDKPVIKTTPVHSPDEAATVAEQKAADSDLRAVDVDKPVQSLANPNDQFFGQQWSFNEVPYVNAWATDGTTGTGVKVAVVDTGVQQNHPDLGTTQVLTGEFFLHSNDGSTAFTGAGGTSDPNGHGTHVAGTIAAQSNNTTGISGAAPGAQVLPVQVLCSNGSGFSSDVASGITWGVDHGAKVVSLSLGGGYSAAEESAVKYASDNDVVVVAAGGNDGTSGISSYPAALSSSYSNVIAVAATTNASPPGHASYSTVASYIDISAPGGSAAACDPASSCNVLSTWNDGGYRSIAGTSMATPHVSAAAALLRAANGACTAAQVKSRLKATANTTLDPTGDKFAQKYGAGLVDPNAAGASCTPP